MFRPYAAATLMLFTSSVLADQTILLDSNLPSDFVPVTATVPTSTGFWALGASDGLMMLAHYDANGVPQILRYPDMQYVSYGQDFIIVPSPGGGVLTTDVEPTYLLGNQTCRLRSFDAAGNYLWTYDLAQANPPNFYLNSYCSTVYADGSGQIWLFLPGAFNGDLYAFNQDGTAGPQFNIPGTLGDHAAADPINNAIYLPGATGTDPSSGLATIWKFTSQGQQWAASAPAADQGSILLDAALAADGSVWAFGNKGTQLFGMHAAANGTLMWSGSFNTTVNPANVRVVTRADGDVSTLHWDTTTVAPEVSTFSSTGSLLWHVASGLALSSDQSLVNLNLATGSDGDVVAAVLYDESVTTYLKQTRFNSNGAVLYTGQPQAEPAEPLRNSISLATYLDDTSLTTAGSFQHLARNGAALASPTTAAITLATTADANARLGPDGSAYTVVTNASSKLVGVSAYSNTGALRWHSSIPSSWSNGGLQGVSPLLLRTSDVCIAGDLDGNEIVQCFALTDGTTTVMKILGPVLPQPVPFTQAKVTANDLIVLLYSAADGSMHHVLIDASGNLLHNITPL
ncbi:MAG: PQQ-like beta-propeller repeat protein, partial [Xanthomonadaceae bacterium]|nr:PQQ-like beta-propeller repeat protein [Xanthomonadaceae bacterium]